MTRSETRLDLPAELSDASHAAPGIYDLPIPGAWVYVPRIHEDDRGAFHESFRAEQWADKLGYPFTIAQANLSRSKQNVIRGIHVAEVPPGQAKFVNCASGAISDVLVDLRRSSPTFGRHLSIDLTERNNWAVYVPVGVGHGFRAHSDHTTVTYLVTEAYNPEREFEVNAFDPQLEVEWGITQAEAVLSDKDVVAPTLEDTRDRLPEWRECLAWEQELRAEWTEAMAESEAWGSEDGESGRRTQGGS